MGPRLLAVHPVLMAHDVTESVRFYEQLGFVLDFQDSATAPRYAAVIREGAELHIQWNDLSGLPAGMDRPVYRLLVDDVDALQREFAAAGIDSGARSRSPYAMPADTPWGTREFHLHDPAGNGLQFYQPL
ncbi:VOC family protein [Pelomonas sp. SE-A7]|uniref:VOC family protein n=1 Tax=Pelomonas sp. SE-A7 TaxID=3054953 RepID=UPI00259D243F|nr:VOC family protein [Pelomonas sp. SE-A7]MDM4766601.1 VOC family protein [Pelomonas sp. SE-A7]